MDVDKTPNSVHVPSELKVDNPADENENDEKSVVVRRSGLDVERVSSSEQKDKVGEKYLGAPPSHSFLVNEVQVRETQNSDRIQTIVGGGGGKLEETTVLPHTVHAFILREFDKDVLEESHLPVPPHDAIAKKVAACDTPPRSDPTADIPPLPPAPADVPPTPDSIQKEKLGSNPFDYLGSFSNTEVSSGAIVRSPYASPQAGYYVRNTGSPRMWDSNRISPARFDLPPGSSRPISPQSNAAMRWSDRRRSGSLSDRNTPRASPRGSSFASSNQQRLASFSRPVSPSINVVGERQIVLRSPGGESSRGSSLGSRRSVPHTPRVASIVVDDGADSVEGLATGNNPSAELVARLGPILFAAVRHNRYDTVEKLITDLPSLVDILDESGGKGNNLLHIACINGYARIGRFLIKSGINIDLTNSEGNTPLHLSYQYGRNQLVSILISHNANENARNKKDHVPAQLLNAVTTSAIINGSNPYGSK